MKPTLQPYSAGYRDDCLRLLRANTPAAFDPLEEQEFTAFLDDLPGPYFLLELDYHIIGCGGYVINSEKCAAGLTWGMIDPAWQGKQLGALLLARRLDAIRADGDAKRVLLDTSQKSAAFFERFGFDITGTTKDGFGPGLDAVAMELAL